MSAARVGADPSGRVAIVGAFESPRRLAPGVHPFAIHTECIAAALDDAGLTLADVDGLCTAAGDRGEGGGYTDLADVADHLGLSARYYDSTDNGGSSFITHAGHAAMAIAAGQAEVVVISYAACPRSFPIPGIFWDGLTHPAGPGQFEIPYAPTLVASYALAARRHTHEYGTTSEQLARVAVACRANAARNPHARYRDPITVDDVLRSPLIASPLRLLDCCVLTDGGGAIVLVGEAVARHTRRTPVWILGYGDELSGLSLSRLPQLATTPALASGRRAFAMAGVSPDQIDVAQLYDGFTIMVAQQLEDLGFCPRGESGAFIESGAIDAGGSLPINTDGGGLSSNQAGRRGMFALVEGVRQLRGEGPGHQVARCRTALVHGLGGFYSSGATMILGRA